ncbi:MAG: PfkB family carbohydrate kinase [Candidatus Freyarchaeota archaeon]
MFHYTTQLSVIYLAIEFGKRLNTQNQKTRKPAIQVSPIIDSIGAGDSFDSGFITGYLKGLSLEKMTDLALKVASHNLKGVGGSQAVPPRDKLTN